MQLKWSNAEVGGLDASFSVAVLALLDPLLESLALLDEALSALNLVVVLVALDVGVGADGLDVVINVLVIAAVLADLIFNLVGSSLAADTSGRALNVLDLDNGIAFTYARSIIVAAFSSL